MKESKMTLGKSLCSWRGIIILMLDGPKKEMGPDISFSPQESSFCMYAASLILCGTYTLN